MRNNRKLRIFALLGMVVFLYILFVYAKNIYKSYTVEKEITVLKNEIKELNKDNEGLDKLIQYYKTPAFREKNAKKQLSLARAGEEVISLKGDRPKLEEDDLKEKISKMTNTEKWFKYFFQTN